MATFCFLHLWETIKHESVFVSLKFATSNNYHAEGTHNGHETPKTKMGYSKLFFSGKSLSNELSQATIAKNDEGCFFDLHEEL